MQNDVLCIYSLHMNFGLFCRRTTEDNFLCYVSSHAKEGEAVGTGIISRGNATPQMQMVSIFNFILFFKCMTTVTNPICVEEEITF